MNIPEILIFLVGIISYCLGIIMYRNDIKNRQFRCPNCNELHYILPVRKHRSMN